MAEPFFEHDCPDCVYLGRLELEPTLLAPEQRAGELGEPVEIPGFDTIYDLYFCGSDKHKGPVIARYNDGEAAYEEDPELDRPELMLAERLAKKRGLL